MVFELSLIFGTSKSAIDKVYHSPSSPTDDVVYHRLGIPNRQRKNLAEMTKEFWQQQLLPGSHHFDALQAKMLMYIEKATRPDGLHGHFVVCQSKGWMTLSVLQWTQSVLLEAATRAVFGEKLLQIDPDLLRHFRVFDHENWKLWYRFPNARRMHEAKAKMIIALEQCLRSPRAERSDSSYIVQRMEDSQRALGLDDHDIASILSMVVFV